MTARQKIESLTNSWYGFFAFTALFSILRDIGPISLVLKIGWFFFGVVFVFFVGRRLLAKGSLTRALLLVVSALTVVFGTLGVGRMVLFSDWSFSLMLDAVASVASIYMYGRSFRVLTDASVKAYFG